MTSQRKESVVLLIQCKDRKGIVARVSGFIHDFGGNILDSDHHTDEETNDFLMRMECSTEGLQIAPDQIVIIGLSSSASSLLRQCHEVTIVLLSFNGHL